MKTSRIVFFGVFVTFAAATVGLLAIPQFQIGNLGPLVNKDTGDVYPINTGGYTAQGRDVYAANGCVYCHTQAVRSGQDGSDIERGWGVRQSVARDYIYDKTVVLGFARFGPDLANEGAKATDALKKTTAWQYLHLYSPRSIEPHSNMPAYRNLFDVRKIEGQPSPDALDLSGADAPKAGYEVVPTLEARQLVAYLLSLDHSHDLPEAPVKEPAKK
ncbi:MAG: cbb3-type cytochrome c oxidase subunit II [Chthoniobacteraceae bacterium]